MSEEVKVPSWLVRKGDGEAVVEAEKKRSPVGLPPSLEKKRLAAIERLGERWLLHPVHALKKGRYNNQGIREGGDEGT